MINKKILTLVFVVAFVTLLIGCLPAKNEAPIITSDPVKTGEVGVPYTYDVNATDPDEDVLTYSLVTKPTNMGISSTTGLINWIPAAAGDYAVVVKVSDGDLDITQSFNITVIEEEPSPTPTKYYTITVTAGPRGSISPSGKVKVKEGSDKEFTITPDSVFYGIDVVLVDGDLIVVVDSYIFNNVTEDHTISATFEFLGRVYNQDKAEHFDNIQDAVSDDGNHGDTILVMSGTYAENVVIDRSLYLFGTSSTPAIIDGDYTGNTVTITASDVTLSGFTVTGGHGCDVYSPFGGVVVDGTGGASALTGIVIEDNIIQGNNGNGIYASAVDFIIIRNNKVYNNGIPGASSVGISLTYVMLTVEDFDEWRRPKNILVEGNDIHENYWCGIYLNSGENCIIRSNKIWGNSAKGLLLASSMTKCVIPSEYNTVEQNEIYNNALNGIKIVSFNHNNTFTANVIYDNGYGAPLDRDDLKYGFLFQDGNDNILDSNIITGNAGGGLYLWGKGDPSYTHYSTTDNIITGNTISDHARHGIYIPPNYGNPNSSFLNSHINGNNITNNLIYGLENADTTQTVDATLNWWGNVNGPSYDSVILGDKISEHVNYIPWSIVPN